MNPTHGTPPGPAGSHRRFVLRRSGVGLALLLTACEGGEGPDGSKLARHLVEAAPTRVVEPRLVDGDAWGPCERPSSGRCAPLPEPGTPGFTRLAEATDEIRASGGTGASRRAVGLAELVWSDGEKETLDRAVTTLESAAADNPGDWRTAVDLAAAYLVRATGEEGKLDALKALDLLERTDVPPEGVAPALFDRALALEHIGLWAQAAEAWDAFLTCDGAKGGWAEEAHRRRQRASDVVSRAGISPDDALQRAFEKRDGAELRSLAARYPRYAREGAMRRFVPPAVTEGAAPTDPVWTALVGLGDALVDRSVADLVAEARAAQGDGSPTAASAQAAFRTFAEAGKAWEEARYEAARDLFLRSAEVAGDAAPTLAAWARLEAGASDLTLLRYAEADELFRRALQQADVARHPLQVGRALWGSGLVAGRTGAPEHAWRSIARAGALYRASGEPDNAAFLMTTAAEMLVQLGRPREAWPYRFEALSALAREAPSVRLHHALWQAAEAALAQGLPRAALVLQDADVRLGENLGVPWVVSESFARRSEILRTLGDTAAAGRDVERARAAALRLDDRDMRERVLADVWVAEARDSGPAPGSGAVAKLDSALAVHDALGNVLFVATLLTERAEAQVYRENLDAAERDLERAVELVEGQRSTLRTEPMTTSFGDAWQRVFDAAIAFEVRKRGDPWRALAYAERSRRLYLGTADARVWGREGRGPEARALPPVPAGTAMVQFVVADGAIFRWILTASSRRFDELPVPGDSLAALSRAFHEGLRRGVADEESGRLLAETLLPPDSLLDGDRLVVVPDGVLNALPFQALPVSGTGRPLVRRTAVSIALAFGSHLARGDADALGDLGAPLLIGNPDAGEGSTLVDLPGAEAEVRALSHLYGASRTLLGAQATREAILRELDRHRVMHYAGHAMFDEEWPEASYLTLAPGNSADPDRLYVRELAGSSFRRLRLVVLSACTSLTPTAGRGGGLWGLARPFLAGGVSSVVGSLWPVDDRVAAALMTSFHSALLRTGDPAAALRAAQQEALDSDDASLSSPAAWAAFVVLQP